MKRKQTYQNKIKLVSFLFKWEALKTSLPKIGMEDSDGHYIITIS